MYPSYLYSVNLYNKYRNKEWKRHVSIQPLLQHRNHDIHSWHYMGNIFCGFHVTHISYMGYIYNIIYCIYYKYIYNIIYTILYITCIIYGLYFSREIFWSEQLKSNYVLRGNLDRWNSESLNFWRWRLLLFNSAKMMIKMIIFYWDAGRKEGQYFT